MKNLIIAAAMMAMGTTSAHASEMCSVDNYAETIRISAQGTVQGEADSYCQDNIFDGWHVAGSANLNPICFIHFADSKMAVTVSSSSSAAAAEVCRTIASDDLSAIFWY